MSLKETFPASAPRPTDTRLMPLICVMLREHEDMTKDKVEGVCHLDGES